MIFDPSMPTSQIQMAVDAIANQQISNQFGSQRYALLFKPGTYGTSDTPLNFQVGYYTAVAGLGFSPNDVVINGSIDVYNQCDTSGSCVALNNFWRSLSNLTINVTNPTFGCHTGEFWAVSQAAPMRRVHINGLVTLMDYCTSPSFASGGFIADSEFDGSTVINGSQQQWLVRNSKLDGWSNGVWNQVFSGVVNAPAQCFPAQPNVCGPYTTLASSPVTREAPYLYVDARGHYKVFVPSVQRNSVGTTWGGGSVAGSSISIDDFFVAKPTDSVQKINSALAQGQNLLFTPGIYYLDRTIKVKRPGTVVLGLGFPTLVPNNGVVAMSVADVPGVKLSGLLFDAGPLNSPVLLQVGHPARPQERPGRPDLALRRVLPNRRCDRRQGHDQPCREQRQRHSGRHLGLAGGPRHRGRLDGQHRRHGRDRQRRQRHGLRPVRRALPEIRGDVERQWGHGNLLPKRDALRPA